MGEMMFPCSAQKQEQQKRMKRTMCTWRGLPSLLFPLSHRAALCPRLTQRRIRFHARTFQAFEAGSSDTKEPRGAAAGNFITCSLLLLHACATVAATLRDIRRSYARNATHAGWIKASTHQNVPLSATVGGLYKLLTCEATHRSPAGVQLHQGGVEGVEGVHVAATCTLLLEGGYELLGGWVSNNLSFKLFSASQGGVG